MSGYLTTFFWTERPRITKYFDVCSAFEIFRWDVLCVFNNFGVVCSAFEIAFTSNFLSCCPNIATIITSPIIYNLLPSPCKHRKKNLPPSVVGNLIWPPLFQHLENIALTGFLYPVLDYLPAVCYLVSVIRYHKYTVTIMYFFLTPPTACTCLYM